MLMSAPDAQLENGRASFCHRRDRPISPRCHSEEDVKIRFRAQLAVDPRCPVHAGRKQYGQATCVTCVCYTTRDRQNCR